jgi:hypothetical protein
MVLRASGSTGRNVAAGGVGLLAGILGSVASSASLTVLILPLSIGVVAGAFMAWQGYYG